MTSPDFTWVTVGEAARERGRARVEREVAEAAAHGVNINPAPPGEAVEDWGIPPDTEDRIHHRSLDDGLSSWGKLTDAASLAIVHEVVDRLASLIGPISQVYELSSGRYVALKFSGHRKRGLAIGVGVLYLLPPAIGGLGGAERAMALLPGFLPSEQAQLVLDLPTHIDSSESERVRSIESGIHCGIRQPVGSECSFCGEVVE